MQALIFALGSGGDVYPFIALGRALQARGHQVAVATNPHFEETVRQADLEFVALGREDEGRATAQNPDLWKFPHGLRLLFEGLLDATPESYRIIEQRYDPETTVVVAHPLVFGARLAHEKLGVPLATAHLQPVLLRSLNYQPGFNVPPAWLPLLRPLRRALTFAVDRWMFDPILTPRLNSFRGELGLPAIERPLKDWIHSPRCVLGLFPEWFAERQPDWPPNVRLVGFPKAGPAASPALSEGAVRYLDEGEPPIVFTLGTAMMVGRQFFEVSAEVCRLLGRRGVFLTRFPEQLPAPLPPFIHHFEQEPFELLLPRAAALAHHGGIGTLASALRAGIPQFIMPMNFDQPDNAARVRKLGVGDSLRPRRYQPRLAAERIGALLSSPDVAAACRRAAARLAEEEALVAASEAVETLGRERRLAASHI